jgi:cytochrome P450
VTSPLEGPSVDAAPRDDAALDDAALDDAFEKFNRSMGAGTVEDPYPELAASRQAAPVAPMTFDFGGPVAEGNADDGNEMPTVFQAFSFEAVQQVLRDGDTFSSSGYAEVMGPVLGHSILEMDEPEHHTYRALIQQAFSKRAMQQWETELVSPIVEGLIDGFVEDDSADLVRQLLWPFPINVIAGMIGLPRADLPMFHRLGVEVIAVSVDYERAIEASRELRDYFATLLAERRVAPANDLISVLAAAELDGQRLDDEEIFSFLRLLLPAGAETTYRSTSNLLAGLLADPVQLEAVRANRALVPKAVEEGLRWEAPLLVIARMATRDTVLCGVDIPEGAAVVVSIGAANRDDDRWTEPERFDINREAKPHLAFAFGPHTCLGMHLARMESCVALEAILDRLPGLRLADAVAPVEITGMTFRAPLRLPVVWDHP